MEAKTLTAAFVRGCLGLTEGEFDRLLNRSVFSKSWFVPCVGHASVLAYSFNGTTRIEASVLERKDHSFVVTSENGRDFILKEGNITDFARTALSVQQFDALEHQTCQ